jgi:2-amino-4-hydroxy-6-hydroxymethyldihydropteridine diphosphokinase
LNKPAVGRPTLVAIALGSNVGDRRAHLDYAVSQLGALLARCSASRFHDTVPVGVSGPHPVFLNAAVVGQTMMSAQALMDTLLAIERARGRERPYPNAPRTLDLDLILFGDAVIEEPGLIVPHPRFRERGFVLGPLAEIAPTLIDPVTHQTIAELLVESRA